MPPSITGWTRLEPDARSEGLEGGLQAAVHDPLWLLARQWQLGEFWGEDAGSPVLARLRLDCTPLTRFQPGGIGPGATVQGRPLDRSTPLETVVEREQVRLDGPFRPRQAAEAGLHLTRQLADATLRAGLLSRFPLTVREDPLRPLDPETRRFLAVTAGRVVDGTFLSAVVRVVRDPAAASELAEPYRTRVQAGVRDWQTWYATLPPASQASLTSASSLWLGWYDTLFSEPDAGPADGAAWVPDRLEYAVAAAAPMPAPLGEVVLAAPEYAAGHLDWYDFDALPSGSLGATREELTPGDLQREDVRRSVIPTPVTFRGMPADRLWEFEDARVDFGAVPAGPQDLARLLLLEFAMVYGTDWLVIPLDVPVGSLCNTRWLVVTDTFGGHTLVPSAREVERALGGASSQPSSQPLPWDLFRLSTDARTPGATGGAAPDLMLLPPAIGQSLPGPPLEEVLLLRDEMANMAWAVERIVESPIDRPLNRSEAYHRERQAQAQASATPAQSQAAPSTATPPPLTYRLATEIPAHWLPLYPVRPDPASPAVRLRRSGQPWGRLLAPGQDQTTAPAPLLVHEEEVPRSGARVGRAYQYTRWVDGRTYLWLGRRKGAGQGEGSSGLRFDTLDSAGRSQAF
jgi:hypothetical protein